MITTWIQKSYFYCGDMARKLIVRTALCFWLAMPIGEELLGQIECTPDAVSKEKAWIVAETIVK